MNSNYVYEIGKSLYINATNKCTNACEFCVRNNKDFVYGDLWLDHEPSVDEVLDRLKNYDLSKYEEIVFCGYGEPTYRLDVIESISKFAHENNLTTRINTNGHANYIHKKDVTDIIVQNIDTIGISLNDVTEKDYDAICHPEFEGGFEEMLSFAKQCIKKGGNVIFSVVDVIGQSKIAKAKEIAESIGAKLRVRELID